MASAEELMALGQLVNGPTRADQLAALGGPTLRAYEPTWRDKLAAALMGDGRASPERRNFVSGLLGSTGIGSTGMGLVDLVPGGQVLGAQEAMRSDDPAGNLAMAIMPGGVAAKGAMPAVKEGAKEASKVIKAYHGSPHDFDRFDLSKIGTGEGAQAYGHGLYFAENEGVAKQYRDTLAPSRGKLPDDVISLPPELRRAIMAHAATDADPLTAAKRAQFMATELRKDDPEKLADMISRVREAKQGRMYEVAIHADPERFLDWDRPLANQSIEVRNIANSVARIHKDSKLRKPPETGEDVYRGMRSPRVAREFGFENWSSSGPSEYLRDTGIPGIKYLDQGSRAAGDGSRNYVLFDDKIVEILKKYGVSSIAALPPAVQLMLMGQADGQDAR